MIYIILLRSHRLPALQEAIEAYNATSPSTPWGIFEIQRTDIAGIPISRCVFIADQEPPPDCDVVIEARIIEGRYCPECLKRGQFRALAPQNRSGYCAKDQDRNPLRNERKKKK